MTLASAVLGLTVFATATPKEKVLHSFNCDNGARDACVPQAALVLDRQGRLYGTTSGGGEAGHGAVYQLTETASRWREGVIYSFNGTGGYSPYAPLIVGSAGNLYGTAASGGTYDDGTAFELSPGSNGWTIDVLHSFDLTYHGSDGSSPWAGLVMGETGSLYGATREGGIYGGGVAFELAPDSNGWAEKILYSFCANSNCGDGSEVYFALIFDKAGNLYGTTKFGGTQQWGTVFELSPTSAGSWKERVLLRFRGNKHDGIIPYGGLVFDAAWHLYGTTTGGGAHGQGTVFKLTRAAHGHWKETVLYSFPNIEDGGYPQGTLAIDKSGALYGIAGGGGGCGGTCGLIYKLAPQAHGKWKYNVVYKFNGTDGMWPQGGVILDKAKKHLYGTTEYGGAYGYGVVFEITP